MPNPHIFTKGVNQLYEDRKSIATSMQTAGASTALIREFFYYIDKHDEESDIRAKFDMARGTLAMEENKNLKYDIRSDAYRKLAEKVTPKVKLTVEYQKFLRRILLTVDKKTYAVKE